MVKEGVRHDYDLRSNLYAPEDYACIVCNAKLQGNTRWTDYFGEAVCCTCEVPYQLLHPSGMDESVELPRCNLAEKWVPITQEYWQEVREPMGLGTYLIARDYKEDLEHLDAFAKWCEAKGYGK